MSGGLALVCPSCGRAPERLTEMVGDCEAENAGAPPTDSVVLCIFCGAMSLVNADGTLRVPSADELAELADDDTLQQIRGSLGALRDVLRSAGLL